MKALLSDANLDDRDRAELLTEAAAHDMSAILGSGHSYALGRCSSETSLGNYFLKSIRHLSVRDHQSAPGSSKRRARMESTFSPAAVDAA